MQNKGVEYTPNTSLSDAKFKDDVIDMPPVVDLLTRIRVVEFTWNDLCPYFHKVDTRDTGVIAQELQKVAPHLVDKSVYGHLTVKYDKFVPYLLKGLQELHAQNKSLSQQMESLTRRVTALEAITQR